ncbi:MAG: hypothetical protein ACOC8X_10135 [Chloroflexota bacterium]
MPDMSECELKITLALARLTYGYHRDEVKATWDDLQKATGLSKQGVADGLKAVKERGFFEPGEGRSMWQTVKNSDQNSQESRLNEQQEQSGIQTNSVKNSDQNSQESRLNDRGTKEKEKESERKDAHTPPEIDAVPTLPGADINDYDPEVVEMESVLSYVCRETAGFGPHDKKLRQGALALLKQGYTPEQVETYFGFEESWWYTSSYGQQEGEKPYVANVLNEIGSAVNGHQSGPHAEQVEDESGGFHL